MPGVKPYIPTMLKKRKESKKFDFAAAIEQLGLNQSAAARFLFIDPRTARSYIAGDYEVPAPTIMLLMTMIKLKISPMRVRRAAELPEEF